MAHSRFQAFQSVPAMGNGTPAVTSRGSLRSATAERVDDAQGLSASQSSNSVHVHSGSEARR
jgi:hypothetical protein